MANSDAEEQVKEFPGQHPGEEVVLVFRQHPAVMRKQLIYGALLILFGMIPVVIWPLSNRALLIAVAAAGVTLVIWFYRWIGWHYSIGIITDQRLIDIKQRGFFNRRVNEVGWSNIQSINYHVKGLQATLLKYGDINIQTYTGTWLLHDIYRPEDVHAEMMRATHSNASTPPMK